MSQNMVFPSWVCSQLINNVPSGDKMHTDHLQARVCGEGGVIWDLCFCPLGLSVAKWGHVNEWGVGEAEVRAVPLALPARVGLPGTWCDTGS